MNPDKRYLRALEAFIEFHEAISETRLRQLKSMRTEKKRGAYESTGEWRTKRKLCLQAVDSKCRGCGGSRNVDVHHNTYDNYCIEYFADLVVLCDGCHDAFHQKISAFHRDVIEFPSQTINRHEIAEKLHK